MKNLFTILILFSFMFVQAENPNDETLEYSIHYGPLKGGNASISTIHKEYKGKEMIFTEMKLQSTGVTNSIYYLNNTYSCYINPVTCLPEKTSFKIAEQEDEFEDEVTYFQDTGTLFSMQIGWDEAKGEIVDLVSLIYNFRFSNKFSNISKGELIKVNFWDIDEIYTLTMKYCGKDEIKTDAGTFQCIKIESISETGSSMNKKMDLSIWITNDIKKTPILLQFNLAIGSIKCELDSDSK